VKPANSRETVVSEALRPWIQTVKIRLFGNPEEANSSVEGDIYTSEKLKVIRFKSQKVKRALFRNKSEDITLVIAESGRTRGTAAGQPFTSIPKRFCFMLVDEEVVDLYLDSAEASALGLQISREAFRDECEVHGMNAIDIKVLRDTLPGHEELLTACARQLLEYKEHSNKRLTTPLESSILSLLAGLAIDSEERSTKQPTGSYSPQQAYVDIAISFFEKNIANPITLTDACKTCNVSARTLQVAFNTLMGRSPLQVLHELRLIRLRQLLISGIAVNTACRQVGLLPSGRISGSYKKMFGELPRDTLGKAGR